MQDLYRRQLILQHLIVLMTLPFLGKFTEKEVEYQVRFSCSYWIFLMPHSFLIRVALAGCHLVYA